MENQRNELSNSFFLRKLLVFACIMFGFGYALVPFYRKFCEATSLNFLTRPVFVTNKSSPIVVDHSRRVMVEFDANHQGSWFFSPEKKSLLVYPGEWNIFFYKAANRGAYPVHAQAVPSYIPAVAGRYFYKVKCFCFKQQEFSVGEVKRLPIVFMVDPKIPLDVKTITVSYTLFTVDGIMKGGVF